MSDVQFRTTPKASRTEQRIDWSITIKVSAADATKHVYLDSLVQESLFLLAEHMHSIADSIAFPELAASTILRLRTAAHYSKTCSLQKRCKCLLAHLERHAQFIVSKREAANFGPADAIASASFRAASRLHESPYAKWFSCELDDRWHEELQRQKDAAETQKGVVEDVKNSNSITVDCGVEHAEKADDLSLVEERAHKRGEGFYAPKVAIASLPTDQESCTTNRRLARRLDTWSDMVGELRADDVLDE